MAKPLKKWTLILLFVCMAFVSTLGQMTAFASEEGTLITGETKEEGVPASEIESGGAGPALMATTFASSLDVVQRQVTGEYTINLTQVGDIDWLHVKGNSTGGLTQIKKAGSASVTFSVYGDTGYEGKLDRGMDANYISYSWTDGMAGYETGVKSTGYGVFFPQNRDPGSYANVGYDIAVTPQPQDSTVVFGIGMWQAKADVAIYADGLLYDTKKVSAAGIAQIYRYQIKVPAGIALKVEVRQTDALAQYGNISFSGLAVSSKEIVDKTLLLNEYAKVKDLVQDLYTDDSWQSFVAARAGAKSVLDKADATQAEVDGALAALQAAQAALVKRVTNVVIDYSGVATREYEFGSPGDQQDRYQTFTAKENIAMEFVQFKIKKMVAEPSDLVVKLYATTGAGLPTGSPLAQTTVSRDRVVDGGFTTAKLSYNLVQNTRYALVLSQKTYSRDQYRWIVMAKNAETNTEYFGKSVSGNFVDESFLGTGILRIVKQTNVDRSFLEALLDEVGRFNGRLYTIPSWSALESAKKEAISSLDNIDADQTEIDGALARLQSAIEGLVLNMNWTELDDLMKAIDLATIKGYTDSSVYALRAELEALKLLAPDASQSEKLSAYSKVMEAIGNLKVSGKYKYETHAKMTAAFGFEADKNASLAFMDGSYQIGGPRPEQHGPVAPLQMVTFGVTDTDNIKWYNKEGYLPVFVSEYTKNDVEYKIETFANKHTVNNKDYVINYSRMTATNKSDEIRLLPIVSKNLIPLNDTAAKTYTIEPGETVVRDYAIEADKYEYFDESVTNYTSLTSAEVVQQGSFDDNYAEMKTYWMSRLSEIVDIDVPNKELVNAFKAGYIYTMIIKDKTYLHVGENGYARLYSHDTIGILVTLIQSGDFHYAKDYLRSIPLTGGINIETGQVDGNLYWDANWKLPWAYAVYLSKTGDASIFNETITADDGSVGTEFEKRVKSAARSIETDRDNGIMKKTYAIDTEGYWTIDNYSALMGLTAYEYIARELYRIHQDEYYLHEAEWAKAQYEDLLEKFTAKLQQTITVKGINYIPASVVQSNNENRMKDSRDANWASMFLFGRWLWDGYLYGADQPADNVNLKLLDKTYEYGINRRIAENTTDSPYNFGGYPHGFYSSAYNAGYGSAALRGEQYRDMGIKAYEFMIEKSMSGPFSWWEGVDYPVGNSPWANTNDDLNVQNAPGGGGSAQHMWGQAVNSKVLLDSLIAERIYDQNQKYEIIVGRGIPKEWVTDAANNGNVVAKVRNYPALQGGRIGYSIIKEANKLVVELNSDLSQAKIDAGLASFSIQLPSMVNNIAWASAGVIDNAKGSVTVPMGTKSIVILLGKTEDALELDKQALEIGYANGDSSASVTQDVILPATGAYGSAIKWTSSHPAIVSAEGKVNRPSASTEVTLTAILSKDNAEARKEFKLKVKARESTGNGGGGSTGGGNGGGGTPVTPGDNGNNGKNGNSSDNGNGNHGDNGNPGKPNLPKLTDVTNHWARKFIQNAVELGFVTGYADGTFRPNGRVTRSEFATMLARALKFPQAQSNLSFADAGKIGAWAKDYVAQAVEAGIITGYEDGSFRPDGKITRLELVTMIVRAMGAKPDANTSLAFADADQIPAWGRPYVAAAYEAGLIQGKANNRFDPNDQATRAEAVTLVLKLLEYLNSRK